MNKSDYIPKSQVLEVCEQLGISDRQLQRMRSNGLILYRRIGLGRGKGITEVYEPSILERLGRILELRKERRKDDWVLYRLWREGFEVDSRRVRLYLAERMRVPIAFLSAEAGFSPESKTILNLAIGKMDIFYPYQQDALEYLEPEYIDSAKTVNKLINALGHSEFSPFDIAQHMVDAEEARLFSLKEFISILGNFDLKALTVANTEFPIQNFEFLWDEKLRPICISSSFFNLRIIKYFDKHYDEIMLSFFLVYCKVISTGELATPFVVKSQSESS